MYIIKRYFKKGGLKMATIESYLSDFTGPEIDTALNRANLLYELFFNENIEKNVL
jgi:hypothetical protein